MAGRRLLIAVGQVAPSADALPFGVRPLIDADDEILVISPTLPGRLDWLGSATDKDKEQADERLQDVLGHLEEIGAEPRGEVGSDDPLIAFDDAVAQFSPTHLLVALRDADRAGWQERGLLEALPGAGAGADHRLRHSVLAGCRGPDPAPVNARLSPGELESNLGSSRGGVLSLRQANRPRRVG